MPNLYDYLDWRGDLPIKKVPLCAVDTLILSRVSYLPFGGIVPSGFKEGVSVAEANAALEKAGDSAHYIIQRDRALLPAVAATPRFSGMQLCGFVNQFDERVEKQFSAMVIKPGDGGNFISYRGTDDTIIGWKEDFNMSFMTRVPAQLEAVKYLEEAARRLRGPLVLGGHSKGGNLAVYAAAFCPPKVQKRVQAIYNYDGPGFHAATMAEPGYAAVRGRTNTIIPQSSVVGLLLEHAEDYRIIGSSQAGLMQHDLYNWDVLRDDFVYLDTVTSSSRFIDKTLHDWLAGLDYEARSAFIDALFSIINATNSTNLKELTAKKWYEHAKAGLRAVIDLDDETRAVLGRTLLALVKSAKDNIDVFMPDFMTRKKLEGKKPLEQKSLTQKTDEAGA